MRAEQSAAHCPPMSEEVSIDSAEPLRQVELSATSCHGLECCAGGAASAGGVRPAVLQCGGEVSARFRLLKGTSKTMQLQQLAWSVGRVRSIQRSFKNPWQGPQCRAGDW